MSQLLFDYTKNKIIELIKKIEKKKKEKNFTSMIIKNKRNNSEKLIN